MHCAWFRSTFHRVLKFLQIKEGGPNFWGKPILQKVWIIWSTLLYFSFKSFADSNFSSFIRFQCIVHDARLLFSESWNFYKLKRGEPILQKVWIICSPPSVVQFWKFFLTQILLHSLDFDAFCVIKKHFSQSLEISSITRRGT